MIKKIKMGMKTNASMMMKRNPSTKSLTKKIRMKSLTRKIRMKSMTKKIRMNILNIMRIMKKITMKKII